MTRPRWELLGFLDDDPARWGTEVSGTPVLGAIETLAGRPEARVVVCTGHPGNFASKRAIVERVGLEPERYATLVHPTAVIPPSCALGAGTVVLAGVVVTVDVQVGAHGALMPQTVLTHDDVLGDYVTTGAGVRLAGGVTRRRRRLPRLGVSRCGRGGRSVLGAGRHGLRWSRATCPPGEVWAGVPARFVRRLD